MSIDSAYKNRNRDKVRSGETPWRARVLAHRTRDPCEVCRLLPHTARERARRLSLMPIPSSSGIVDVSQADLAR